VDDYSWVHDLGAVDLNELSNLYRIAPLGDKPPDALATVFGNSMFMCFVYAGDVLVVHRPTVPRGGRRGARSFRALRGVGG